MSKYNLKDNKINILYIPGYFFISILVNQKEIANSYVGRKRVIFYESNLWMHSQMKWRQPSLASATTPQKTHPMLRCPWSSLSSHPFAEATMVFSPKGERGSGSACFFQKQMISRQIAIMINIWPKVLSIPRNLPKILYTEIF